jgi:hypothetical protein
LKSKQKGCLIEINSLPLSIIKKTPEGAINPGRDKGRVPIIA